MTFTAIRDLCKKRALLAHSNERIHILRELANENLSAELGQVVFMDVNASSSGASDKKVSGFRELSVTEISYVNGGLSIPEGPTEAEIQLRMRLQTLSASQYSDVLSDLGKGGAFGGPMGRFGGDDGYAEGQDYCGSGWTNGIVPDSLFGVDISYACFVHDQNYSENSTMDRAVADLQFARDIFRILTASGVNETAAAQAAAIYFAGVRGPGFFAYEGQGSPL